MISTPSKEVTILELSGALQLPTVEARLDSVSQTLSEDAYLTSSVLLFLAGLPPTAHHAEPNDARIQRMVLNQIARVRKSGDNYILELKDGLKEIQAELPIYKKHGNVRVQQGHLDLTIRDGAFIQILPEAERLRIEFNGVKVGRGWLMITLPTLYVQDNWGSLMGFTFWLQR